MNASDAGWGQPVSTCPAGYTRPTHSLEAMQ